MSNNDNVRRKEIADYLKEFFEIEGDSAGELIDSFVESIENNLAEAEKNFKAGNWQDLNRNGHSIKGSAANVGANELSAAGSRLEAAAKAQEAEVCKEEIRIIGKIMAEMK
jgi:HPt (histidine-containing phosphotransfer) domain-containing protein